MGALAADEARQPQRKRYDGNFVPVNFAASVAGNCPDPEPGQ